MGSGCEGARAGGVGVGERPRATKRTVASSHAARTAVTDAGSTMYPPVVSADTTSIVCTAKVTLAIGPSAAVADVCAGSTTMDVADPSALLAAAWTSSAWHE